MKKIIFSKHFVFSVILFCVIVLFSVSSFATVDITPIPDEVTSVMSDSVKDTITNSNYYLLFYNSTSFDYILYYGNYEFFVTKDTSSNQYHITVNEGTGTVRPYSKQDNGSYKAGAIDSLFATGSNNCNYVSCDYSIINASYTVKDSQTDEVFITPPPVVQGTLAPIYQEITLKGVLQEIVEILPIVLVTIVGLIGLRKALAMLSRVLHQS